MAQAGAHLTLALTTLTTDTDFYIPPTETIWKTLILRETFGIWNILKAIKSKEYNL